MNIVKGCVIRCELFCFGLIYFPVTCIVVSDEYISIDNSNTTIHSFIVEILEQHRYPGGGYNGRDLLANYYSHFAVGKTVAARAGDLYNGKVISVPDNYQELCAEKAERKAATSPPPAAS